MNYLNRINKACNISELEKVIKVFFQECDSQRYIPAILKEGLFTMEDGEDFYLKLTLFHRKSKLNKAWPKENLAHGMLCPDDSDYTSKYDLCMENVITHRRVKGSYLYQVNPHLGSLDEIEEYEYDNNDCVNAYYHDGKSHKGSPVLEKHNSNIYILKDVLLPYLNKLGNMYYPKYILLADYEFRTHTYTHFKSKKSKYKTKSGFHEVLIDEMGLRLFGSLFIEIQNNEKLSNERSIQVVSFPSFTVRKHDDRNKNDDMNAGFVIFKKEILTILKEQYYFYDLQMFNKTDLDQSYLVDVLPDKVVFWEGEYNKLPEKLKEIIDDFNFVPEPIKDIVSPGMDAWQIGGSWNFKKKLEPALLLAYEIRTAKFNLAAEVGLSFLTPENNLDFCHFINKIERVTDVKLERFDLTIDDVQSLLKIRNGQSIELPDLNILYQKYCYQIYQVINNANANE